MQQESPSGILDPVVIGDVRTGRETVELKGRVIGRGRGVTYRVIEEVNEEAALAGVRLLLGFAGVLPTSDRRVPTAA